MVKPLDRRDFMRAAALAGAGITLDSTFGKIASAAGWQTNSSPYGALTPTTPVDGGIAVLALPPGFSYRVLSFERKLMSDGLRTPPAADGMAAFSAGGFVRLLRNHETTPAGTALGNPLDSYDPFGAGGVTTLIVDPSTRVLVRDFLSLSGTVANCSGGPTPWNSWISCEETLAGAESGFDKPHGYCFEVPSSADRPVAAIPLKGMGRFNHEAVAVDPATGIAYLTEDEGSAGFYRYVPNVAGQFALGGRLQMLAILGSPQFETRRNQVTGRPLPVVWVDIADPDPVPGSRTVYLQGRDAGGARFRRLEGAVAGNGSIYFASTSGGNAEAGQIWRYTPSAAGAPVNGRRRIRRVVSDGTLTLLVESRDAAILKAPDNICLSPRGSLLICEDSAVGPQYVRCFTPAGELFDFVRNSYPGLEHSELAGATFSPDGETLFLNVYGLGMTVAIWGPWATGPI